MSKVIEYTQREQAFLEEKQVLEASKDKLIADLQWYNEKLDSIERNIKARETQYKALRNILDRSDKSGDSDDEDDEGPERDPCYLIRSMEDVERRIDEDEDECSDLVANRGFAEAEMERVEQRILYIDACLETGTENVYEHMLDREMLTKVDAFCCEETSDGKKERLRAEVFEWIASQADRSSVSRAQYIDNTRDTPLSHHTCADRPYCDACTKGFPVSNRVHKMLFS